MNYKEQIALLNLEHETPEDKTLPEKYRLSLCSEEEERPHRHNKVHKPKHLWLTGTYERTETTKQRQSESMTKYWASERAEERRKKPDAPLPHRRKHPEGWVDKRKLPHSEELRKKQGEGIRQHYIDHPEDRLRQAEYMRNRPVKPWTDEMRKQKSEFMKGKKYWNNGVVVRRSETCPGPDFVPGRIKGRRRIKK